MAPDGQGRSVYAALYDARDFGSFAEFEAWIAWTTGLQDARITEGPSLNRVDWSGPQHLDLPYATPSSAPTMRHAIQALAAGDAMRWVRDLGAVQGRLRSEHSLDAEVDGGWLTLFRLDTDDDPPCSWYRVDLPDPDFRIHLVSDLVVKLRVDLAGLGFFDASHDVEGSRVWFKASRVLLDALNHGRIVLGEPTVTQIVTSLVEGEDVYLTGLGMLEADQVVDPRGSTPRTTHIVRFQPDRALLLDLEEAVESSTVPPRR